MCVTPGREQHGRRGHGGRGGHEGHGGGWGGSLSPALSPLEHQIPGSGLQEGAWETAFTQQVRGPVMQGLAPLSPHQPQDTVPLLVPSLQMGRFPTQSVSPAPAGVGV